MKSSPGGRRHSGNDDPASWRWKHRGFVKGKKEKKMAITFQDVAQKVGVSVELVELLCATRGTTLAGLVNIPEGGLRRAIRRLTYPDLARARHEHLLKIARDDDGRIPPNAVDQALTELKALRKRLPQRAMVAGLPVAKEVTSLELLGAIGPVVPMAAGLAPNRWRWLGPGNVGGRTRAIAIHPVDSQRMLAASAGGGVWFTQDGGARWDPVDDFMANLAVCCLAVDPKDPNQVYAGTGEGFGNGDALRGAGIFRIVGGNQWKQLSATQHFPAVNRIAVSADGKVMLAATPEGLQRSVDAPRARWRKVLAAPLADVKFHPANSKLAIAGGLEDGQAYFSKNKGRTWQLGTHATAWSGRVELAYARKNPNVVYASVQGDTGELWRSDDGGKTYQRRRALDPDGQPAQFLGDQGWYGNTVWAGDPGDENLVLVGGINLWRSVDGGDTLAEISTWWDSRSVHADHHCIVSHPGYDGTTNRTVFFGHDGGISKATDIRVPGSEAQPPYVQGWVELNNNYGVTQFYGGAVHSATGRIVAGTQDNGSLCLDPGEGTDQWHSWFGGDGGWCASDPTDPQVFYGEYVFLNIHRNMDGCATSDQQGDRYISGQFWDATRRDWAWKPVPFQISDARTQDALFIAPFVLDSRQPDRLLGGGLSLWETKDAKAPNTPTSGPRWSRIKPSTGRFISAIAISPANSNVVWVGHQDGAVFVTTTGTSGSPAWQRCPDTGPGGLTPKRYCTRIVPHPTDLKTAYVTFGGFNHDNVWQTQDSGSTWAPVSGNLPAAPVYSLAIHPRRLNFIYVGTEVGIFGSEDSGVSWSPTNEGPANVSVNELFWNGQTLVCASHGRGMFSIDLKGV
jgi:photosystem II stability/assembly factor-like uncharacterized protein